MMRMRGRILLGNECLQPVVARMQKEGPGRFKPLRPLKMEDGMKKKSISYKCYDSCFSLRKFARKYYKSIKLHSAFFSAASSSSASWTAHFLALADPK